MSKVRPRALRDDLGFKRPALVLSGGGAMGAYAVGVLQTLEAAGVRPAILTGVSVGAITAVAWTADDFRTGPLTRVWSKLTASGIGLHWNAMALRLFGAFVMTLGVIEAVLTLAGSSELSVARLVRRSDGDGVTSTILDMLMWLLVGVIGWGVTRVSRDADEWLHRVGSSADPGLVQRALGMALVLGVTVHLATWITGAPWPHRFSATLLLVLAAVWSVNRAGPFGTWARGLLLRLLPETGGRGVWRGGGRRRLLERLVAQGDPRRLVSEDPHLILLAVALDSGRLAHFTNWASPTAEFKAHIERYLGEVVPLQKPEELILAAVASSAIPVVFEPVSIRGRSFVDAGGFTNQPIHAVMADGADAVIVVLVSPRHGPRPPERELHVGDVMGRVLELADWRDLQSELLGLPPEWLESGSPARLVVIQPEAALTGGLLGFDTAYAAELMRLGAEDAWQALDAAGWLAKAGEPARAHAHRA